MKVVRGLLIDLDGTLYQGNTLIPGAKEALTRCYKKGIPYRFVTNTTSKPRTVIVEKLEKLGIAAQPDEIFTAPAVARDYLQQKGFTRCYFLLKPSLFVDLEGIEAVEENPQAVVVGDLGDDFTYNKLNRAFRFLQNKDCAFITLARNRFFQGSDGLMLDVGPFVTALEYATQREAVLVGKPAPAFFQAALRSMKIEASNSAMIGDDLEGDVAGGQSADMQGVLVKTGKFRNEQLIQNKIQPDAILSSIAELEQILI